ncbi:MAG TPA: FAD-dependent oxidoreductase [Polyangia bacterium]|jgi:3-phenylpropionate/trans-cinnamate dioxygenase ferredoxin reductase subunit
MSGTPATPTTCVIVGAGVAGHRAAVELRQAGFDGRIVLVGDEPERPYQRPPLSKELLAGDLPEQKLFLAPADFYAANAIDLRPGARVVRLDPADRAVELEGGERLGYDRLLIATGAAPRRLRVPGADLAGVFLLRTLADARRLRAELRPGRRAVIVGGGFIGTEVAAACRRAGVEVALLAPEPVLLASILGEEVGRFVMAEHAAHGVALHLGEGVAGFRGDGQVRAIVTAAGAVVPCDFAVVGVGVEPAADWLVGAGVTVERGILTDARCRTNVPDVFAAGDVARAFHPGLGEHLRFEHFDHAGNQGAAAAQNMLGRDAPFAPVPQFWSDQYDLRLQLAGDTRGTDVTVRRGRLEDQSCTWFYLKDGVLRAALGVNRPKEVLAARRLIQAGARLDRAALADAAVDLKTLRPAL